MVKPISKNSKFTTGRYRMNEDESVAESHYLRLNRYTGAWDVAMGKNDAEVFDSLEAAQEFIDDVAAHSGKWNKTPYQYFIREKIEEEVEVYKSETIPPQEEPAE